MLLTSLTARPIANGLEGWNEYLDPPGVKPPAEADSNEGVVGWGREEREREKGREEEEVREGEACVMEQARERQKEGESAIWKR